MSVANHRTTYEAKLELRASEADIKVHRQNVSVDEVPKPVDNFGLVEQTWKAAVALGAEAVGVLLFKNIFEIAPGALELFSFKDDVNVFESPKLVQHAKGVVKAVATAVSMLRTLDTLVPILQRLGKSHVPRGVLPEHYDVVGQALVKTLSMGLGDAFTPEVAAAWTEVYGIISTTMIGDNYQISG